ncbi:DUF2975 domain-containing protein [Pontibacter sp. SGAir0037]|uniref:DUF2975 domain-containing protein n=1 Tax=Pontibacter sp. SGAir0037 TaxID=2571030 RepID=UPI0010CCE10B|nr:DUF2975 domain-containing protein [Pontibacter sp. SGAir0037]QCR23363.1 hypothetical protein C1N53_14120 [Pontibacter sp. SGAir0037]
MKKNVILNIASIICLFFCAVAIISLFVTTLALIHWHFNPNFYADFLLVNDGPHPTNFLGYERKETWTTAETLEIKQFALNNISHIPLYLIYLQSTAIHLIVFFIMKEFLTIIKSVRLVQSFRTNNITSFRKIGKYLFLYFLLTSYYIVIATQGEFYGFYLHLTPLVLMLIAFIMAEIFKEGNIILEENQLTV